MISSYRKMMERMYEIADKDEEVQMIRENIKKILEEIEMLKEVYEGESSKNIRAIIQKDLENQIKNYAKVGSKILLTQIQCFTRIYLKDNPDTAKKLFDKYKKDTSKKQINEPYPFEIRRASKLFVREIVNAMNIDNIEKTYEKLDDFIDVSKEYFENKLKTNYIEILRMAGDFFRRYDLLETYNLEYNKNMEEVGIKDIQYDTKKKSDSDELSIEETFSTEYLEKLDIHTLMSLNIFWQNRMAKDSKRIYTALYVLDKLELLERDYNIDDVDNIPEDQIKELIARKIFINRLATFKVRNYIEGEYKNDSSLSNRIEGYAREYNQIYGTDLEKEIESVEGEQANNENIYLIKNHSIAYLIKMLSIENTKISNWGIIPEVSDEVNSLLAIDLPGYNMAISVHSLRDILVSTLNSLNTEKTATQETFLVPVYDGHYDMEINYKHLPTNILMPLNSRQKGTLKKQALKAEKTDNNYKVLQHLYANSKGEVAEHLKKKEIRNGVTFIERKRIYYDILEEKYYEKDSKGHYMEYNGGYNDEGR